MLIKILLAGDGGQGIQLISDMLAQASFVNGFFVLQIPNYGLEQRGGVSLSFLQISDKEVVYPRFSEPDVLLIMSEQAEKRVEKNLKSEVGSPKSMLVINTKDKIERLKDLKINPASYNIFFLGLLTKELEEKGVLKKEKVFELLEKKLSKRDNWIENERAFQVGTL